MVHALSPIPQAWPVSTFVERRSTLPSNYQFTTPTKRTCKGNALQGLQLDLKDIRYLVIEEMSMIGQRMLAWMDKRLRQATGKLDQPMGGLSLILFGDFGQIPPAGDQPLYAPPSTSELAIHGHSMYRMFTTVVVHTPTGRQEVGLCNGAAGLVHQTLYYEGHALPSLPIAILVDFVKYCGPRFLNNRPNCVPIPPMLSEWMSAGKHLSRQQLPLQLRYAMTIHKSQGQTLDKADIDTGRAELAAGCTFVAISRLHKLADGLFKPLAFD